MNTYSKPHSIKSNARRAARKASVDPKLVVACAGGFHFPLFGEKNAKAKAKAKQQPALKLKGGKGRKTKSKAPNADHRGKVLSMILAPGGAKIGELVKATGLLPHTLRARISELKRSEKLNVKRERLLGVTIYSATRKSAAA